MLDVCERCDFFTGQEDDHGEMVVTHCNHPRNPNDDEGNTVKEFCPLVPNTVDEVIELIEVEAKRYDLDLPRGDHKTGVLMALTMLKAKLEGYILP